MALRFAESAGHHPRSRECVIRDPIRLQDRLCDDDPR